MILIIIYLFRAYIRRWVHGKVSVPSFHSGPGKMGPVARPSARRSVISGYWWEEHADRYRRGAGLSLPRPGGGRQRSHRYHARPVAVRGVRVPAIITLVDKGRPATSVWRLLAVIFEVFSFWRSDGLISYRFCYQGMEVLGECNICGLYWSQQMLNRDIPGSSSNKKQRRGRFKAYYLLRICWNCARFSNFQRQSLFDLNPNCGNNRR